MARILIVDDVPDWQTTLRGLLVDEGHQVVAVGSESKALQRAVETEFDLAIVDVRLRGDDEGDDSGLDLARTLKAITPQIKVILLTGFPVRADFAVKSIRIVRVEDFIQKSDNMDLTAKVEEVLGRPSFELELNQLALSFELGQPIVVRTRGAHVCARRTKNVFQLSIPRYNRLAQDAADASNPRFNAQDVGKNLYRDVFRDSPEVFIAFEAARAKSRPLCLSIEGARDFVGIPFEFIFSDEPADYLVLQHPLTRFINSVVPRRKALSPRTFAELKELRILIVASDTNSPIPGVDYEAQLVANFLDDHKHINVRVNLILSEEATLPHVRKELEDFRPHIFHYAGHGQYDELSPEESALFFQPKESSTETSELLFASELKILLEDSEVHFVYFSCCQGTTTGSQAQLLDDDFLGITDAVIQAGVPSALGYRWPVSDDSAPELALAFYKSLFKQGSPEIALWEARREIAGQDRNDLTWLSPILIHQA